METFYNWALTLTKGNAVQELNKNENTGWLKATAALVPLFFSGSIEVAMEDPIRGEEAICLSMLGYAGPNSPVGLQMKLRGSFDRQEAKLLTEAGIKGLLRRELVRPVIPADVEVNAEFGLQSVELTTMGLKIWTQLDKNLSQLNA